MISGLKSRLVHQVRIAKYHLRLRYRKLKAKLQHLTKPLPVDKQPSVFASAQDGTNPATGNLMTYDTGGKPLRDAYAKGFRHVIMPEWYQLKWYHFGSLSWSSTDYMDAGYMAFKAFQKEDIKRRAMNKNF